MARRIVGLLGMVVGGGIALGLPAAPAAADCSGPTITYAVGPVAPGETVHVTGTAWGDGCYDTGPPPEGEGVLGRPQDGILILLTQGDVEAIVAEGAAGADYEFEVDVPVPVAFGAGEARLVARRQDGGLVFDARAQPITISDAPAVVGGEERVGFGPVTPDPTEGPATDEDDGAGVTWVGVAFVALVTGLGALALSGALVRSPRRARP